MTRKQPPKDGRKRKGKRKRGEGLAGVRKIETYRKMAEAMDYRLQGHTFAEIGEFMKLKTTRAYELVSMGLRDTIAEPSEDVRAMELRRLDKLQSAYFANAVTGDIKSADLALKIMAHRANLMGLGAPKKLEHTGKDGKPIEHEAKIDADAARSALAEAFAKAGITGAAPASPEQPKP